MTAIISRDQFLAKLKSHSQQETYLAMYSSFVGGIVTDPALMLIPIDDHIVHRGDGIFEALKFHERRIYLCQEHLDRLYLSAEKSSLKIPWDKNEIKNLLIDTLKAARTADAGIRIYISRGPGGFSPNPYESIGTQLYIVVTKARPLEATKYTSGVSVGVSKIPVKEGFFSTLKSCNYLHNVLMKKEAVDNGWDFPVNITSQGFIGEGATENIAFISTDEKLIVPSFNYTLRGTTLLRMMELASDKMVVQQDSNISLASAEQMKEVLLFGTTIGVLPVVKFNGKTIADGKPGNVWRRFHELYIKDVNSCPAVPL